MTIQQAHDLTDGKLSGTHEYPTQMYGSDYSQEHRQSRDLVCSDLHFDTMWLGEVVCAETMYL